MRMVGAAVLLLMGAASALAQSPAPAPLPPARPAQTAAKPQAAKPNSPKATYDAMSAADRSAIQSDLVWSGDYNGVIGGEFGDRAITAVKDYQKRTGGKDTGILTPQERTALAQAAQEKQAAVGWRLVTDSVTGIRLGLPSKLVPQSGQSKTGSRWQSARGEVRIETFREQAPATLAAIYEQQRKDPGRKVDYNVLRPDFFVLSGLQSLKKFYMRAQAKDNEVRGVTILYDQAMEGILEPAVVAMSSAFAPFPASTVAVGSTLRRKVDYGTGVIVSAAGDIVTDAETVDGCQIITVAGLGDGDRIADDKASGISLLRLYGARELKPLALGQTSRGAEVTLVGIADPVTQAGNAAVTAVKVHPPASSTPGAIEPTPAAGFAGAAVIDGETGFAGLVTQRPQVVAGPTTSATPAAIAPADAIRSLLATKNVTPNAGRANVDLAKESVVRVICVRK